MEKQAQQPKGPDDAFKQRFAFTREELDHALKFGCKLFPDLTSEDVERAVDLVHELLFQGTEEHPISIVDVFQLLGKPEREPLVASMLLADAYPRWRREGKIGEYLTGGTQTFIHREDDSQGRPLSRSRVVVDDGGFWPKTPQ
ncbi:MAG: hypothetical protein ABH851_03915 [Methanobacteriota archaeon]